MDILSVDLLGEVFHLTLPISHADYFHPWSYKCTVPTCQSIAFTTLSCNDLSV